jgi:hypothetical protein
MNRPLLTALTVAGLLSLSSGLAYSGSDAPVDKGGMPPSTEMNAGSGPENALPPGTIGGGNGADANGSSTSPGTGSANGGSSKGSEGKAGEAGTTSGGAGSAEGKKGG